MVDLFNNAQAEVRNFLSSPEFVSSTVVPMNHSTIESITKERTYTMISLDEEHRGSNLITTLATSALSFFTVAGNMFVIAAAFRWNRVLIKRKPTTLLIINLAFADLMVGGAIMPFGVAQLASNGSWPFARWTCRLWASLDVICSSASILTLCLISIDRFIGITQPLRYGLLVTKRRLIAANMSVWMLSITILLATIRWETGTVSRDESIESEVSIANFTNRKLNKTIYNQLKTNELILPINNGECNAGHELQYALVSTIFSFFIPLVVILTVYFRIFQITRYRQKSLLLNMFARAARCPDGDGSEAVGPNMQLSMRMFIPMRVHYGGATDDVSKRQRNYDKHAKSAKTLSLVVGAFLICWIPFFVMYPLSFICPNCISPLALNLSTWLGYLNSTINPVIYTVTMRSYRHILKISLRRTLHYLIFRKSSKRGKSNTFRKAAVCSKVLSPVVVKADFAARNASVARRTVKERLEHQISTAHVSRCSSFEIVPSSLHESSETRKDMDAVSSYSQDAIKQDESTYTGRIWSSNNLELPGRRSIYAFKGSIARRTKKRVSHSGKNSGNPMPDYSGEITPEPKFVAVPNTIDGKSDENQIDSGPIWVQNDTSSRVECDHLVEINTSAAQVESIDKSISIDHENIDLTAKTMVNVTCDNIENRNPKNNIKINNNNNNIEFNEDSNDFKTSWMNNSYIAYNGNQQFVRQSSIHGGSEQSLLGKINQFISSSEATEV